MTLNNTSPSIARALLDLQGNKQTNQGINTNYQIMGQDPNAQALDVNNPSFVEQAANETIKQANATLQPQTPSIARTLLDIQQKPKKQSPSIANAILALGKSMSQNTNQGQMINGNYVPNTTIGTSLSGVSSGLDELNQRDKAQALEQERYNQAQAFKQQSFNEDVRQYDQNFIENKNRYNTGLAIDESRYADTRGDVEDARAFRNQGYGDSRLDRASDEDFRNRQLSSQEQQARDALNAQRNAIRQKQEIEQAKQQQENKANELQLKGFAEDKVKLEEALINSKDYIGTGGGKGLMRSDWFGGTFGTDANQAINNIDSALSGFFSRNIRFLPAYAQGILTDADFQNAVKGAFNPKADLQTNIDNMNSTMRSMFASKGYELPQELYLTTEKANPTNENDPDWQEGSTY